MRKSWTFASRSDRAYVGPPAPGTRPLDGVAIARTVERETGGRVGYVPLEIRPDRVVQMFVAAPAGRPPLPYDAVWADPYSGKVRLTYRWGGVHDGLVSIVPFLFGLHYGFVAGPWGSWTFGVAALVWTVDCFIGFYLALPRAVPAGPLRGARRRSWWRQWSAAWRVRRHARGHRLTFDLHRASGLWLWPLLLVFAWSSVGLLLPSVERPVMRAFGASDAYSPPPRRQPLTVPPVPAGRAVTLGGRALVGLGRRYGFTFIRATGLSYDPVSATYRLDALTTLDRGGRNGGTSVWIDARGGQVTHFERPFGGGKADAIRHLFLQLHFAAMFGLPYRLFVSIVGLLVATLSVTGVLIWMKKRSAARRVSRRRAFG